MYILKGEEKEVAQTYLQKAIEIAQKATCSRSKCGCVIVKDDIIIGSGYNSPPNDLESQKRCSNSKNQYHKKVTDKTCCIHAEQRAMFDALKNNSQNITGSRLYFIRLDEKNQPAVVTGMPYCTICSKMALDLGIKEFVLVYENGFHVFNTEEYNDVSFKYENKL
jgi:deoxycytidylate deaminase